MTHVSQFAFILDDNFEIQNILEDFVSLEWERNFFIPNGVFRMVINLNLLNSGQIQIGRFIAVTDSPSERVIDRLLRVEQIEFNIDGGGSSTEFLTVIGRDVGGMFQERLIIPPGGSAFDEITDNVETVMKHYVTDHAGSGAAAERQIPDLVVLSDQGRGDTVTYQGRYETLAKVLETLAFQSNIGWEVTFDVATSQHQFEVIIGVDRSITSSTPVLFDVEFQTVTDLKLLSSTLTTKSFAVVGGPGEAELRTIVERFTGASEPTGFDRKEIFVDAQNLADTNSLELKGDAALAETQFEDIVEATVSRNGQFMYRRDWDLGDIITVRNVKWGLQKDMRVIGVKNLLIAGEPTIFNVVKLDRPFPTLKDRIIEQFNLLEASSKI